MQSNLTFDEVNQELAEADIAISDSEFETLKTWVKCKIQPVKWKQKQYDFEHDFWVVAILNGSCLYFNFVEEGWGWGKFSESGSIVKYHWEQEELGEAFIWRYKDQTIES
ncbi:hypothetical protein [Alteromonas lipotrueae]|uniref:hypothetical protein n=1 Tax=Alteromonas lipotrueae TaxID=2803814 RepID=UPI001C440268|nr:hypothetical protein [Alteromonas lipotrueae]